MLKTQFDCNITGALAFIYVTIPAEKLKKVGTQFERVLSAK